MLFQNFATRFEQFGLRSRVRCTSIIPLLQRVQACFERLINTVELQSSIDILVTESMAKKMMQTGAQKREAARNITMVQALMATVAAAGIQAPMLKRMKDSKDAPVPLSDAFMESDMAKVKELLKCIEDVHLSVDIVDYARGGTALMSAAQGGHSDVVSYLVEKGADVKAANKDGWTALMCAAVEGHSEIVGYLVEKGADVKAVTQDGGTALMCAAVKGHAEIVGYLVKKGADVKAVTKDGRTALNMATDSKHKDVVEILKGAGA